MKKILSLILAGLMTVSCAAFVAADDAAVEATTDSVQDYAIEFLSSYGIFKGGEGLTNEDLIQRYQMALFVSRISTGWVDDETWEDGIANDATFKDIDTEPASKYLGALSYANQNGLIEGYTANTFAPYAHITYRDALTMVVRTLGYKGLAYPWGNIEKAVELGLTDGVDAAYTDELTRGEVAVIIYNALFAKNAKGSTLANDSFDLANGWEDIIIVSTDEYSLVEDNKTGKFVPAPAGYIGFKTIDASGKLSSEVYYVNAKDIGMDEGHDAEKAVGHIYLAMFELDETGKYAAIDHMGSELVASIRNNGLIDGDKTYTSATLPIATELAKYAVGSSYITDRIGYDANDLIVYGYKKVNVVDVDGNSELVGIDPANGNIMFYYGECKDTANHGKENHKCGWFVEWFFNDKLEQYYRFIVDNKATKTDDNGLIYTSATGNVYIDWMTESDFNDWYKDIIKDTDASTYYKYDMSTTAALNGGKAPYAKLDLYNIDNDDAAEIGAYKEYAIGMFYNTVAKCSKCNADKPAYKITDLEEGNGFTRLVEEGHAHEADLGYQFAWLNVADTAATFDATKAPTYKAGVNGEVVLYAFNESSGEIEIVKHITGSTGDDKIITGVLQAYSTANKTITIDGVPYKYDYPEIASDVYNQANAEIPTRYAIGATLDEQYMQYVTAVIIDDYIVDTDLLGEDKDAIVVLGYAGITSDGYIAVYGYKTDDLKLDTFKINTYNGWKKGDYRYYPENADKDNAFDFGALYSIKSYDSATNSYGVYTENVETVLENAIPVRITFKNGYRIVAPMDIVTEDKGASFIWTEKAGATAEVVPMTNADKYVIVENAGEGNEMMATSNIYTQTGIITENEGSYAIDGMMVGGLKDTTIVLYSMGYMDEVLGIEYGEDNDGNWYKTNFTVDPDLGIKEWLHGWAFCDNAYEIGYILYEGGKGTVLDAAYDEAQAKEWYLLGSTASTVRAMNLLTGEREKFAFNSSNIDLVPGHVYKTIGGCILKDVTDEHAEHDFQETLNAIAHAYRNESRELKYADYIVETDALLTAATLNELVLAYELGLFDIDGVEYPYHAKDWDFEDEDGNVYRISREDLIEAAVEGADAVDTAMAKKLIKDASKTKIYVYDDQFDFQWNYSDYKNYVTVIDTLAALDATKTYEGTLIYDVKNQSVVFYVFDIDLDKTGDVEGEGNDMIYDGITDGKVTGSIDGFILAGKNNAGYILDKDGKNSAYEAKWTVDVPGTTDDRYFDIKIGYNVKVTYSDELCQNIEKLELVGLELTIVETKTADGKVTVTAIDSISCNSDIHDLLADAGIGFGHINECNVASGIETYFNVRFNDFTDTYTGNVVEAALDDKNDVIAQNLSKCGLIYNVKFDLSDEGFEIDNADGYGFWFGVYAENGAQVRVAANFEYMSESVTGVTGANAKIVVDEIVATQFVAFDLAPVVPATTPSVSVLG